MLSTTMKWNPIPVRIPGSQPPRQGNASQKTGQTLLKRPTVVAPKPDRSDRVELSAKKGESRLKEAYELPEYEYPPADTLWQAVHANNGKQVDALLSQGKLELNATDKNGYTPLAIAVRYSNDAMVKKLLAKGADVNQALLNGKTPLILAARYGRNSILKELLQAPGIQLSRKDNQGKTALAHTHFSNFDARQLLKKAGATE